MLPWKTYRFRNKTLNNRLNNLHINRLKTIRHCSSNLIFYLIKKEKKVQLSIPDCNTLMRLQLTQLTQQMTDHSHAQDTDLFSIEYQEKFYLNICRNKNVI